MSNTETIKEMPYERFRAYGAQSLTNAELLAVILRTGSVQQSAVELSRQVLTMYDADNDKLSVLYDLSYEDLIALHGIGEVKAVKLLCIAELARRMARESVAPDADFSQPEIIAGYYMEELRHEDQEHILLVLLNNRLARIRDLTLSIGTVNGTMITPREVYRQALQGGAVSVVLLHNHPSGDPTPSLEDIHFTREMIEAGSVINVPLIDHIIIGDGRYISMKKEGYFR